MYILETTRASGSIPAETCVLTNKELSAFSDYCPSVFFDLFPQAGIVLMVQISSSFLNAPSKAVLVKVIELQEVLGNLEFFCLNSF